ncbi:MAG: NAD-dependent epimerase/dehydratase family protein [Candidatus Heimdallarchaeota archaeon]
MGRVIAVTGISGFIGSQLIPFLHETVPEIDQFIGIDIKRFSSSLDLPLITYKHDIRNPFHEILLEHSVTDVVHLAWTLTPDHDLTRAYSVDIGGTNSVLDSSMEANIKYLLHTSSTLAYGAHQDNPPILTEEMPLRGNKAFHYSLHKALAEELIENFEANNPHRSFKIGRLRPAPILSPGLRNWFAEILQGGWRTMFIQPYPRGETKIQFLHIRDALQGFGLMLRDRLSGAFNLTPNDDDGGVRMGEIPSLMNNTGFRVPLSLLRFIVWIQWKLRISRGPPGYLDFVAFPFVASNEKLKRMGFQPMYTSREAISLFKTA